MPKRHVLGGSSLGRSEMTDYEKQRMKRIEENKARMEALGLHNKASSLMTGKERRDKEKEKDRRENKRKGDDDDDEYMPPVDEQETGEEDTSSGEQDEDQQENLSHSRTPKGKKKVSTPGKKVQVQKNKSNSGLHDEDEAFLQAIALSLKEKGFSLNEDGSGLSKNSDPRLPDGESSERKGNARSREESGTRKRKKQVSSQVQMTEDELVVHFFQFDVAGKCAISVKDVELMAATHDFTWTDRELSNMIHCFDSNGDGRLSLDDFRKIVGRCNMIRGPTASDADKCM